jgi:hypothetical protein
MPGMSETIHAHRVPHQTTHAGACETLHAHRTTHRLHMQVQCLKFGRLSCPQGSTQTTHAGAMPGMCETLHAHRAAHRLHRQAHCLTCTRPGMLTGLHTNCTCRCNAWHVRGLACPQVAMVRYHRPPPLLQQLHRTGIFRELSLSSVQGQKTVN